MKVFSGIQPTSEMIHIGNYFGAIRQWLDFEKKYECIFSVVNLHALTSPIKPKKLEKNTLNTFAALIALGINYKKSILFIQSQIPEHAELTWILNRVTPYGDLKRMTQFKDKSLQFKDNINAGLFNYPVLMAADILLYNVDIVPVGADQFQHLELTREIARRFNNAFSRTFKIPKTISSKQGSKIMSLIEPTKKMSKSKGEAHYLGVFEPPSVIKAKIAKAVTDSGKEIKYDPKNKAGISNLITIYSLLTSKTIKQVELHFKAKGYADLKNELSEIFIDYFKKPKKIFFEMRKNKEKLNKIIYYGQKRAKAIASQNIAIIKKKVGII